MTTSSKDILTGLLSECSELIMAGATIEACVDRYPEHAVELEPLLRTVARVRVLREAPPRPAAAAAQTRAQFMAAAVRLSNERNASPVPWGARLTAWWAAFMAPFARPAGRSGGPRSMPVGLLATMLLVILVGAVVTGSVTASATALPGDLLYPLKTATERVQLFLTSDPVERFSLQQEFSQRRIKEAQAVAQQGRRVSNLPLEGTIEVLSGNDWTVSGLVLALAPDAQIIGTPVVGARVQGILRAPGNGQLILIYAEIEAPPARQAPVQAPGLYAATPSPRAATATAGSTPTGTAEAASQGAARAVRAPRQRWDEPDGWSAVKAASTATVTPGVTGTPTRPPADTPTATLVPTSTPRSALPTSRPMITYVIEGWVSSITGSQWVIGDHTVKTDEATQFIGDPGEGHKVRATVRRGADGSYTALRIVTVAEPEATPEPIELTGILEERTSEWWTISGRRVKVTNNTQIEGNPQIGDLVSMKGEQRGGEIWALRISMIPLTEVQFEGIIKSLSANAMVVGGNTVLINNQTQIIGTPEVGRLAQVAAVRMPNDSLVAKVIMVMDATATPTWTVTRQPTSTPTPTDTPEPTPTDTPEPTPTDTPEPTPTDTPEPTPTDTPEPTPTDTPEPTPTDTPEPTPTDTPVLAPTDTWSRLR